MLKFSYSETEKEKQLSNGTEKTVTTHTYEDATMQDLTDELKKLEAKGYDITVSLKLKIPKD